MNRIINVFAVIGAWMLVATAVSIVGGPCLAWDGSFACAFGKRK